MAKDSDKTITADNDEWKQRLTPAQYTIMREKGTEAPFSGEYWDHKGEGVFKCAACGAVLFSSKDKFDSGTGWPSFTKPASKNDVTENPDSSHGMKRTEVICSSCKSHLGHVFDDGPDPSGRRYCINSASLSFCADKKNNVYEKAYFAGGCFWCMQPPFDNTPGVISAKAGYSGGKTPNPDYEDVSRGDSGHREVIEITYDPEMVSYSGLIEIFWKNIDPTQADGQFADRGEQYKTAIYYQSEKEREEALKSRDNLEKSGRFKDKIATEILPAAKFYPAEEYHQSYYKKNPEHYKMYKKGSGRQNFIESVWK